ncbi:MAG TPA: hypothetical protein VHO06_05625 [Polyangia bacterium]|nr:hypothetical protein [Polyangia bacterium]
MTRPSRRWKSLSAPVGAALLLALVAHARPAAAQACCAGGALVSPVRLAPPEDYAVGLQTRVRNDMGLFGADGSYLSSSGSASGEQDLEQDLAVSVRVARRAQVSLVLPYVETHRSAPGLDDWGSGIGDLALNARYDFKLAAEMTYWPGFALLGGVVFPTGKAVGDGTNPAATDATGTGTFGVTLGADIEKVHGPLYGALNVWGTYSGSNTSVGVTTSYPPQLTVLAVAGYVFESEAAAALYVNFLERGDTTVDGRSQPGSGLRLTTAGLTGLLPIAEDWRVSASIYTDVLLASFGVNEQAGAGATATLVRAWR